MNGAQLQDLLKRVPAHLIKPGMVFICAVLLGAIITFSQPRIYQADARIWVQHRSELSYNKEIFSPMTSFFTSPLVTAAEIVKSNTVLKQAAQNLNKQRGLNLTVQDLAKHLDARPIKDADVLEISYKLPNGKQAAEILQAIVDAFIDENNAQSTGSATQSRLSIEKQLETLKRKCEAARKTLKEFQDRNQAVSLPEQVSSLLKQAAGAESEIEKYKLKIAEQRSKVDYLQSQLGLGPEDALVAYRLAQDEELSVFRKKIAIDQARLISLRGAYRDEHPYVKELHSALVATRAEAKKKIESLGLESAGNVDVDKILSDDPVRQKLLEEMVAARSNELSAESGLTQTTSLLADTNSRLANIPAAQGQLAELIRKENVASESLSEAEKNLQNAQLNEAVASHAGNIRVISWPEAPSEPAYPNIPMDLGISVLCALVLAVLTFIAAPTVWRSSEVARILNLPIIGWMENLPSLRTPFASITCVDRIRLSIQPLITDKKKYIVITSPDKSDGKTALASSLAVSFAGAGAKVLLIDANPICPQLHSLFGVPIGPGLTDYQASAGFGPLIRNTSTGSRSLAIVTKGSKEVASASQYMTLAREMVHAHGSQADLIIIDSPAFTDSPECLSFLDPATILLVVARLHHSHRASLQVLQSQLRRQQVASAGIVLIGASDKGIVEALQLEGGDLTEELAV